MTVPTVPRVCDAHVPPYLPVRERNGRSGTVPVPGTVPGTDRNGERTTQRPSIQRLPPHGEAHPEGRDRTAPALEVGALRGGLARGEHVSDGSANVWLVRTTPTRAERRDAEKRGENEGSDRRQGPEIARRRLPQNSGFRLPV